LLTITSKNYQNSPHVNKKNAHSKTLQLDYPQKQLRHLIQKKPLPLSLNALIKIHKPDKPIRQVVTKTNTPTYKIAKFLVKKLHEYLHLIYHYNFKDSISLANDLTKVKIDENHKMITFDIKEL
jgi:hypothetical protein